MPNKQKTQPEHSQRHKSLIPTISLHYYASSDNDWPNDCQ